MERGQGAISHEVVIDATDKAPHLDCLGDRRPAALWPILNVSLFERTLESLTKRGVTRSRVLVRNAREHWRRVLQARAGKGLELDVLDIGDTPLSAILGGRILHPIVAPSVDRPVLVVRADCLRAERFYAAAFAALECRVWPETLRRAGLDRVLPGMCSRQFRSRRPDVPPGVVRLTDPRALWEANRTALAATHNVPPPEPSIIRGRCLGRQRFGAFSVVSRTAVLRGDVILGERSVVAERSHLQNCLVLDETLVGPDVALHNAILLGDRAVYWNGTDGSVTIPSHRPRSLASMGSKLATMVESVARRAA